MTQAHQLLPWQGEDWQRVVTPLRKGRLAHALLLTGASGIGKWHFAGVLARALLCQEPLRDGLPCGDCPSCVQIDAGSHPDTAVLVPEKQGGVIKIGAIRDFVHVLYLTAQHQRGRVGVIHPADRMTTSAANSLLKALEEPPAGSHILLVSEHPGAILATIRSRCQNLRLSGADAATASHWLEQQNPGAGANLLPLVRGAPLRAAQLQQAGVAERQHEWFQDLLALAHGKRDPVALADSWLADDADALLDWLCLVCLDVLKVCVGTDARNLLFAERAETITGIAAAMNVERLRRLLPDLLRARRLRGSPVDARLSLESLCILIFACRQKRA